MLLGKGQKGTSHCVCVDCEEDWPYESKLQRVIEAALETEGVDVPCAVDVLITDDAGIHQANLETRGVDRPTDVLSFPMFELSPGEKPRAEWADPDTGKVFLGDMVISLERANEQAEEYGSLPGAGAVLSDGTLGPPFAGLRPPGRGPDEAADAGKRRKNFDGDGS